MKPRIRLLGLLGVIALVASIELRAADRMPAPQPLTEGVAQIREGLAAQMRIAASGLEAGHRLEATTALNRARHLASAAAEASTLDQSNKRAFRAAREGVERARHAMQDGDPATAVARLAHTAADLDSSAAVDQRVKPTAVSLDEATGRTVVNSQGATLGKLLGVGTGGAGAETRVRIGHGGLLGIGARVATISTDAVLIGRHYVAIASDATAEDLRDR